MTQILNENEDNKLNIYPIHEAYLQREVPTNLVQYSKQSLFLSLHGLNINISFPHAS